MGTTVELGLAKRGRLVRRRIEPIIANADWSSFAVPNSLFLAYLAVMKDGARRAQELLDVVPEDFRDGLFIACLRLNSPSLDSKLMAKFREWGRDPTWGNGTGELGALHVFIQKWLRQWPVNRYSDLMKLYFERT